MQKLVILALIVLAALLVSCGEPAAEPTVNETVDETPEEEPEIVQNDTVAEPEEEPEVESTPKFGRAIFVVTDAPLASSEIDSFEVELGNLEVHSPDTGWQILSSARKSFNLTQLEDDLEYWLDVALEPGKYTQIRFTLTDADVVIDGVEYDLDVPSGLIKIVGVLEIEEGETATATLDFELDKTVHIAGGQGYFRPVIRLITTKNSEIELEDGLVTITGGESVTDKLHGPLDIFTQEQLNKSDDDCNEECEDFCEGGSSNACETECETATEWGCETEDEEECRKKCEPFMHPVFCRDACQLSSITECQVDLAAQCELGCSSTEDTCLSDCSNDCEVTI